MVVYVIVGFIILGVVGFIGLGVLFSVLSKSSSPVSGGSGTTVNVAGNSKKTEYKVGDTFTDGGVEVTITKFELREKVGHEFLISKPAEGGVYVCFQWKYKNISAKPIGSFSTPSLKLIDPNGVKYDRDSGASGSYATEVDPSHKVLSDLNPGITVTDADIFEVSKDRFDQTKWKLIVNGDDDITVSLQQSQ